MPTSGMRLAQDFMRAQIETQHPLRLRKVAEFPLIFGGEQDELRYAAPLPSRVAARRRVVFPPERRARRSALAAAARARRAGRERRARAGVHRRRRALGARAGHLRDQDRLFRPRRRRDQRRRPDVARPLGQHAAPAAAGAHRRDAEAGPAVADAHRRAARSARGRMPRVRSHAAASAQACDATRAASRPAMPRSAASRSSSRCG